MEDLYLTEVNKFVSEFISLFNSDAYIPKSKLDSFYDKYKDIIDLSSKYHFKNKTYERFLKIIKFGYDFIDIKNDKYVDAKLKSEKSYFDNMFINVDPKIKLDEEQRRAILIDEDYSLVVAGAGSGKTTTMAAKVKYLIEKKHVNPSSIILLSFTNSSVDDLDDLLNNKFKLGVEVLTFHKLGMKFLRGSSNKKYDIISENGIYKIIEEYFLNGIFRNKNELEEYLSIFSKFLFMNEDALKYDSYDEYYKHYMDSKYRECEHNIDEEIDKRIDSRTSNLKTINGELVKSIGEVKIANFLYRNGIDYNYESLYPHILNGNRTYKPDFTIYDFDTPIYIEYFGLAKYNMDGTIESDSKNYVDEIYSKRKVHSNFKTNMIELYGRYELGGKPTSYLASELAKKNVVTKRRTSKEILYRLLETSKAHKYTNLINLFIVFINIFKEKGYKYEDFNMLENKCNNELILRQLKAIKDVYLYYERRIRSTDKIDFQDMINYAYDNVETFKKRKQNVNYEYVIIDEYQDVSLQRYNFIKRISDFFKAKIVAVGDDWQAIYSFSGSDINLFVDFEKCMGYSKRIKILNTYRNSQELIDTAGDFVLKNENQIDKRLHSNKHLNKPIRLVEYNYDNRKLDNSDYIEKLIALLKRIYEARPDDNLLLLTRYNSEIDDLIMSKRFFKKRADDNSITCKDVPNLNIDILTVHKSKGLGYDRVVLLNGINATRGFPSKIKDEEIIKFIKGDDDSDFDEFIDYPEERRLFYVAMTRTKNELYIMTPKNYKDKSDFVKEINNNDNVKVVEDEKIVYNKDSKEDL